MARKLSSTPTSTRAVEREKLADLRPRFPIGTRVKVTRDVSREFLGTVGKVIGYDLGSDDDAPLIRVRYERPVQVGSIQARTGKYHDDEIALAAQIAPATKKTAMTSRKKKPAPYTSESLEVSRRMIAPGPLHEEHAIIYDLMTRFRQLQSTLRHYDRSTGKPIAAEAEKLRKEAWKRIEALPEGDLRTNLSRRMYEH